MSEQILNKIIGTYNGYDIDQDGVWEIESLKLLNFENSKLDVAKKLVIVLVESRLLKDQTGINYTHTSAEFLQRLLTLKQDLLKEGFESKFLELQLMQPKPVSIGTAFSWVNFQLPQPQRVTAGSTYGLAIMSDVQIKTMQVPKTGVCYSNDVTSYDKGFANPFGNISGSSYTGAMSIYATGDLLSPLASFPWNGRNWTIIDGKWDTTPSTSTLVGSGSTEALITTDNTTLDYSVTMDTIIDTGPESSIVIRFINADNFYWMGIGCWGHQYSIGRMLNGIPTELAGSGLASSLQQGATYKLKATAIGNTLTLYVNGTQVLQTVDNNLAFGAFGIRTYNSTIRALNISADPPPTPMPTGYLLGNPVIGTIPNQNNANTQSISYFKCRTSGIVTNIMAYVSGATSGNCIAAIYNSLPSGLLQQSSPSYYGGKALLAIREFFKSIRTSYPNLEGALLVGSFPDAKITHLYPEYGSKNVSGVDTQYYKEAGFVNSGPRFDLILADLDGNWASLYQKKIFLHQHQWQITSNTTVITEATNSKVTITNPRNVLDQDNSSCPTPATLYDTFFIQDTEWTQTTLPDGRLQIEYALNSKDPEVSQKNKGLPNPIASPSINISRINARSIAVQPPPEAKALDANGKPQQAITSFSQEQWTRDPNLERTLLIDYFDRNHAFRNGKFTYCTTAISVVEWGIGTNDVNQALDGWNHPQPLNSAENATLLDFVRWIKRPATFRFICTHASGTFSMLRQDNPNAQTDVPLIENECGGYPWRWTQENNLMPSFKGELNASFFVLRTLWENKQLANICPSLLIHGGCDANTPENSSKPYYDNSYGTFQNAETLLFYGNNLSILCHVTWWNQGPSGFGNRFGSSRIATFGDGWKGFFEKYQNTKMNVWDRKRPYEWSILGDWTMRKDYAFAVAPTGPPVLDQQNNPAWGGGAVNIQPANHVTQTFIPTLSNLFAVEVALRTGNAGRGGDNVTLKIHDEKGIELRSITAYVPEGFDGFFAFNIFPLLYVRVGQPLNIELCDTGKNVFHWKYAAGNPYPQGQAIFYGKAFSTNDFYFRTYGISVNPPTNYHSIKAKHSGKCLDVSGAEMGNGANVQQWDWWSGDNQKWQFELLTDCYFKIIAKHSGKCLDVSGAGMGNGANVQQWDWLSGDNQKWKLELVGDGYFKLTAKHSGKCLDVASAGMGNGANVQQWDWCGGDNQKWKIIPV
jgi:hypothetical protein